MNNGMTAATGGWRLNMETLDKIRFGLDTAADDSVVDFSGTGCVINTWYHIVATTTNFGVLSGTNVYVNGVALSGVQATSGSLSPNYTGRKFAIGVWVSDSLKQFDGRKDEIGIWDRELTATEVTQLYNGGAGLAYPLVPANNSNLLMFCTPQR